MSADGNGNGSSAADSPRAAEMVRLLDEDPALGADLAPSALESARRAAIAPMGRLSTGPSELGLLATAADSLLGVLLLDGIIARHVGFGQVAAAELLGPGDMLRPLGSFAGRSDGVQTSWEALSPIRFAVLDRDFAYRIRPWPEITAALIQLTRDRIDSQVLQSAIRQLRRVEDRLLFALWHFAERWGEAIPEGQVLPLARVSGEVMARIVGARRQSVSTAMGALADRGLIRRQAEGRLLLIGPRPQLGQSYLEEPVAELALQRRAADRPAARG